MLAMLDFSLGATNKAITTLRGLNLIKDPKTDGEIAAKQVIEQVTKEIDQLKQALDQEKLNLAARLGYPMCRCTFPPQIVTEKPDGHGYICENCGKAHMDPKGITVEIL